MRESRKKELIEKSVSGTLSDRERRVLDKLLNGDDDLRFVHDQQQKVARKLGRVPSVDAPESLRQSIMQSIDPERHTGREMAPSPSWWDRLRDTWESRPGLSYSIGLVTGAAVVIITVGVLLDWSLMNSQSAVGAIGAAEAAVEFIGRNQLDLNLPSATGRVDYTVGANETIIGVELDAARPLVLRLEFEPQVNEIAGFVRQFGTGTFKMNTHGCEIRHRGENHYVITIRRTDNTRGYARLILETEDGDVLDAINIR